MNFLNLPAYQGVQPLNFNPIMQALQSNQENALAQQRINQDQQRIGLEGQRVGFEKQRVGFEGQRLGWEEQRAPVQLKMLQEQIAHLKQQGANERELAPLQRQLVQAQASHYDAQSKSLGEKSEVDAALGSFIKGMIPPAGGQPAQGAAPPGGAPSPNPVQPQSYGLPYGGGPPGSGMSPIPMSQPATNQTPMSAGDPNLIRVDQPAGGQPARPQQPPLAPPSQKMINTPMGPMTESRARQLGMVLALAGKGDAGKLMVDEANRESLDKGSRTKLDEKELNTTESLARLSSIADTYKPEYLTWKTQAQQLGLWAKGKITGTLSPEQEKSRKGYEAFKSDTLTNLNSYIKDITGAAMTESEAKRIIGTMPNMEDDPAAFEAKLGQVRKNSALAVARYRYLRENGFKGQPWDVGRAEQAVPLQKMHDIIRERAMQHLKEIKGAAPGMPEHEIYGQIKQRIGREFGIDA